jgi:hypothetical protein
MSNEKNYDFKTLLAARKFDPTTPPPPEEVILKIGNKTVGTVQNYIVYSGQAKAGKSTYLSATIASAFLPQNFDVFGIKLTPPPGRNVVAYFDTESSQFDFWRTMVRIRNLARLDDFPLGLDAFNLRQDGPKMIRAHIWNYLENTPDCAVIVVDGFLDLCMDYNDPVETRKLTNWMKLITAKFNVLMIGVLHLSKGIGETLGHLGSNTDRWAQSTLIVEKNKEAKQFVLRPKFMRSDEDFEPIAISKWEDRFVQVQYEQTIQQQFKNSKK